MKKIVFLLTLILPMLSYGQEKEEDAFLGQIRMFDFNYAFHLPVGDLADRYGAYSSIGTGYSILTKKNIQLTLRGNFSFGNAVNDDVLSELRNDEGLIIGADGRDAIVFLRMRGAQFKFMIGKILSRNKDSRSGLKIMGGLGYSSYWIRLQDDSRSLTQSTGAYLYGYDRKVAGLSLEQFAGYQLLSKNQRLNFFAGLTFSEAFTKNKRPFNFVHPNVTDQNFLDINIGLRAGFILSFYKFDKTEEIFY